MCIAIFIPWRTTPCTFICSNRTIPLSFWRKWKYRCIIIRYIVSKSSKNPLTIWQYIDMKWILGFSLMFKLRWSRYLLLQIKIKLLSFTMQINMLEINMLIQEWNNVKRAIAQTNKIKLCTTLFLFYCTNAKIVNEWTCVITMSQLIGVL